MFNMFFAMGTPSLMKTRGRWRLDFEDKDAQMGCNLVANADTVTQQVEKWNDLLEMEGWLKIQYKQLKIDVVRISLTDHQTPSKSRHRGSTCSQLCHNTSWLCLGQWFSKPFLVMYPLKYFFSQVPILPAKIIVEGQYFFVFSPWDDRKFKSFVLNSGCLTDMTDICVCLSCTFFFSKLSPCF